VKLGGYYARYLGSFGVPGLRREAGRNSRSLHFATPVGVTLLFRESKNISKRGLRNCRSLHFASLRSG
jgi:hypothetical protein